MKMEMKDLTPELWPALEQLFGKNGACGGCWCMSWRIERGEKWDSIKGGEAKRRMKALVKQGEAHGVVAFIDKQPVGWCAYGRRPEFSRLNRAPSLACTDAERVWSLPCFFVSREFRCHGVATEMLKHALSVLKKRGANIAEGYPVKPAKKGAKTPDAFAWTGTRSLFKSFGFRVVGNHKGGKQRVRKSL